MGVLERVQVLASRWRGADLHDAGLVSVWWWQVWVCWVPREVVPRLISAHLCDRLCVVVVMPG